MAIVFLRIVLLLLTAVVAIGLAYHYSLLLAGWLRPTKKPTPTATASYRFAIAIPAHNEAQVVAATVQRLRQMTYPTDRFDIHLVADHCSDETATIAQSAGAEVHIRNEGPRGRKGYAVDWLIHRLLADPRGYDAIAIFDADSQVDASFLTEASRYLAAGAKVVQGRHVIANPAASRFAALADADMRLNNLIRNQAKENLGLSARLMGDAMVFCREVLEGHPWLGAGSLTEDRDYGIYLVTQGVRVRFAADAVSEGQAVTRWQDATPQRLRWYGGAFELQRRYLRPLASLVLRERNLDALDKLLELVLPPFSILALGSVLILFSQGTLAWLGVQSWSWFAISAALLGLTVLFPFLGLTATAAPKTAYRALISAPLYILWRAGIALRVRLHPRGISWIRTRRTTG